MKTLVDKFSIKLRLIGIANSKKMLFAKEGMPFNEAISLLNEKGTGMSMENFYNEMLKINLPDAVFIDCTASDDVSLWYDRVLNASISVVTPNKRACSGDFAYYQKLKAIEAARGVKFLYETNVGAGLPIIKTLSDLIASGDKILKIEAVLSGSLSFIFNSFVGDKRFSDIVKLAQERGYTEPDPRDDLSGTDVARKILILAREAGSSLELKDISVQSFLPESCMKAPSVDAFFAELKKIDSEFDKIKKDIAKSNKKLRFLATYENNSATVKLEHVSAEHQFASLAGSDNVVAFTTDRYKERQLVVQGPGAGAEVTAAGVFADIMLIANYLL